jgi:hypothetical protein
MVNGYKMIKATPMRKTESEIGARKSRGFNVP